MASNSNTGAPRLSVEIGAITTDLKKGLADARAEIQKFNKEVSKSEYKNVLDAERLATQKARTEAVKFASDLKSSLSESLNNAKIYTENARKATEDYRQSLLGNKSALEQSKIATEQQRQATEAERTALANSRSELARIALEKRKGQQVTIALAGSYREAQQRLTALGNTIKNAEGGFNSKSRAIRAQINEYNQLNNKLKDFDRQMGNNQRNVGNYKDALLGVIPVVGQLTSVAGAIALAYEGIQKSFNTNLRFDSIQTALANISGDTESFNDNMSFLTTISDRLGLSFLSTADAFKMWQGAAKFSNLTADESRSIFESVANAGAKLKLSNDDVRGTFLALSQIMSKGKVQAEELRGQIGERLPGAFSLASKAMGVTEQELNKMLETGQVIASDFLPKFAVQLDKSFGNDKTEKIESMQASVNRLSNEFDRLFVSSDGKSFFQSVSNGFANILAEINDVSNGVSRASGWFDILNNARKRGDKPSITGLPLKGSDFAFTNIAKGAVSSQASEYKVLNQAIDSNSASLVKNKDYWKAQLKELTSTRDGMVKGSDSWDSITKKINEAKSQLANYSTAKPKTNSGNSQAKRDLEDVKKLTEDITKSSLSEYDRKLFDIDKKYADIAKKIKDPDLLGLAEQGKQAEVLKVRIDQLSDSLKAVKKLGSGLTSPSGVISLPTQDRLNAMKVKGARTPKIELDEFTKEFQSTLRRGLSSTFNEFFSSLGSMSNASYEIEKKYSDLRRDASAREIVALNEMERLEKSINNGLTNTLSKIGATFSQIGGNLLSSALSTGIAKGDFKDLAKLFSGDSKAIGYGALGSLAGSALAGAFKPTDTVGQGLSGALSGAGTGVAIGTMIGGPLGTVLGGIGGALIGGLSSIFGSSKAKKQEELAQKQYEEQKKQTLLMERQAQLSYSSQIIGIQTANGAVTSIERNEFGELVANIKGSDIDLVLKRYNSSRG